MSGQEPRLLFVYNADGGLVDVVLDAAHKILSPATYQCDLCRLTHGWFRERAEWRAFIESLDVEVEFLHRDALAREYPGVSVTPPAVLFRVGDTWVPCVDAAALAACESIDTLIALVRERCIPQRPDSPSPSPPRPPTEI